MPRYQKDSETVEAIQWTGQNYSDVMDFVGIEDPEPIEGQALAAITLDDSSGADDPEASYDVQIGDYVIRRPGGWVEVVTLDDFDYEPVE
jgi:hypothetical protein